MQGRDWADITSESFTPPTQDCNLESYSIQGKITDFYNPKMFCLIEWFFSEYVTSGYNGLQRLPIQNYLTFPNWTKQAFDLIFHLYQNINK